MALLVQNELVLKTEETTNEFKIVDLSGRQFGNLMVLDFLGQYNNEQRWKCVCNCGNTVMESAERLQRREVQDCGCEGKREVKTLTVRMAVPKIATENEVCIH